MGHGKDGEGGDAAGSQFFGQVLAVGNDGGRTYAHALGYFLVRQSRHDARQHIAFAGRELRCAALLATVTRLPHHLGLGPSAVVRGVCQMDDRAH